MMKIIELSKEFLSEKVTNFLRKRILLGKYEAGYHLSEVHLSQEMAVSRGPVRDAIHRLESEGLVETPGNGRTFVVGFGEKDVKDLFDVRYMLESDAIRLITANGHQHNIGALRVLLEQMKYAKERSTLIELDVTFHYKIVELSQNRTLMNLWRVIQGLIRTLVEITTDIYGPLNKVTDIHEQLLEAIERDDPAGAQAILKEHLSTGVTVICERIRLRDSD